MRQLGAVLWPRLRAVQIYGANTGVGKTVVSTLLCKALRGRLPDYNVHYLKPISTGPLDEADNRHLSKYSQNITSKTLLQFDEPVSPHIAARSSKEPIDDESIVARVHDALSGYATNEDAVAIVETAGGVLSPAPSGSLQADLYRTLRLPVLLVGDHRLGGIGATISAFESLHIRGYDVASVLLFGESRYDNHSYLREYFAKQYCRTQTLSLPPPPEPANTAEADEQAMLKYYESTSSHPSLEQCIDRVQELHDQRIERLQSLPLRANSNIWHPFMQHTERSEKNILAIDSASGDYFQTYNATPANEVTATSANDNLIVPAFDGSASWWTQGLGHGNPELAQVAAHAAGRYGHVMFAGAAHEPAVSLAETLIAGTGNERLTKCFYTDNGSTGMEVAVKMALKAASKHYGWDGQKDDILILGLKGSYHGDTLGTMDCSEPSTYNKKVEWYRGKGHWLDFPTVKMRDGKWIVEAPEGKERLFDGPRVFDSLDDVFALEKRAADAKVYSQHIKGILDTLVDSGAKFGALIMEPVILGAGGMLFADPLFQHLLVKLVRSHLPSLYPDVPTPVSSSTSSWRGMPVVFDEVFTGLYRLGRFSSSSFLRADPDISVHAKLLTGGLLPLCTTLASESIFEAFLSPEKSDALLHGHSYTAHAVGCDVARYSLSKMAEMDEQGSWDVYKADWTTAEPEGGSTASVAATGPAALWSMWSQGFVRDLSLMSEVESVFALGSVLAISLKDPTGSGYTSTAATGLRDCLLRGDGVTEDVVHSRVLGNVLYLMASITTKKETLAHIEGKVREALR